MKIDNFYLRNVVNDYLGYDKEKFTQDDLDKITSLKIDNAIDIFELSSFLYLKELTIYDKFLTFLELEILSNFSKLDTIYFINCNISELNALNNKTIETLYFEHCIIENIYELNNLVSLKTLHFDNMEEIDLNNVSIIRNIENLSFHNTHIINEEKLIYLDNIINLDIYNTNIQDLSIFEAMDTLKVLVIDKKTALNEKDLVLKLIAKGISVINEMGKSVVMYYE